MSENLLKVYTILSELDDKVNNVVYWIPSLWLDCDSMSNEVVDVAPITFFRTQIEKILSSKSSTYAHSNPIVYCMLPRYTTAFDHNRDGRIDLQAVDGNFFETGTLLKSIALLPYLKALGVNIIYLLPITEIGLDGRKGNLGSPYAIKNHYKFDSRLTEPFLSLDLETQFSAFVEAAHCLGMKVVLEFVFRTASLDSDLALEHPEWFYWIYDSLDTLPIEFNRPHFDDSTLMKILEMVEKQDFFRLPPPDREYIELFTEPPTKVEKIGDRIFGFLSNGIRVRIPNGFADWPPNDLQPVWSDVTYLKLYEHPDFNYIAYNTVRMYDSRLVKEGRKVEQLWEYLANIIPSYIAKYDIDGAMIDMGHSMPPELLDDIIRRARKAKKDFIFWEENFTVEKKSKKVGYDAVLGYLPFDQHLPNKIAEIVQKFEQKKFHIPFFLAPETHNTPRSARFGCDFNKLVWAFNSFLEGLRFILTGFELCDAKPLNTGLCFTEEEVQNFPPEKLPLFSVSQLDWEKCNIVELIQKVNCVYDNYVISRQQHLFESHIFEVATNNANVVAYQKKLSRKECLLIVGNFSASSQTIEFDEKLIAEYSGKLIYPPTMQDFEKRFELEPYGVRIYHLIKR
jgi:glycosidase